MQPDPRSLADADVPDGFPVPGHFPIIEIAFLKSGRFSEGMPLAVKFRADNKQILESPATALDDTVFQIQDSTGMIKDMVGAKELAFRISYKETIYDRIFKAGAGADKAITAVLSACRSAT